MVRVKRSITIDKELWEKVKQEAEDDNMSVSRKVENHIKSNRQYEWEAKKIQERTDNDKKKL